MGKVDVYNLGSGVTGFGDGIKVPKGGVLKDFPEELIDEGAKRLTKGETPFLAIVKAGATPPKAFAKSKPLKPDVESVKPEPIPEADEEQPDWESPHRQAEAPDGVPEIVAPSVYAQKEPEEAEVVDETPQPDQDEGETVVDTEEVDTASEAIEADTTENTEATTEPEISDPEPEVNDDSAPEVAEEEGPQGQEEGRESEEEKEDGEGGEPYTGTLPDPFPDDSWKSLPLVEFIKENQITVSGSRTKPNMLASIRKHYGVN